MPLGSSQIPAGRFHTNASCDEPMSPSSPVRDKNGKKERKPQQLQDGSPSLRKQMKEMREQLESCKKKLAFLKEEASAEARALKATLKQLQKEYKRLEKMIV